MFREGTNKVGLAYFIVMVFLLLIYLAWQSGDVAEKEVNLPSTNISNYYVVISYNDDGDVHLWRYEDYIKFYRQEDQVEFYVDLNGSSTEIYDPINKFIIQSESMASDFVIDYDPLTIIDLLGNQLSYVKDNNGTLIYYFILKDKLVKIELNDYNLPKSIGWTQENRIINYSYFKLNQLNVNDVKIPEEDNEVKN